MKITLVNSMIGPGGAERVLTTMANELVKSNDVAILTFNSGPEDIFYTIKSSVDIKYLNLLKKSDGIFDAIKENIKRISTLRRVIREIEPDVVVSFLPENNILVTLSCLGFSMPVILTEHTDPVGTKLGKPWGVLRKLVYRKADVIVVLNSLAKEYFKSHFPIPVVVIPNPVIPPAKNEGDGVLEIPGPYIITIGRLVENKKTEDIIRVFSQINNEYKAWRLVIVGDGPLREKLQRFTKEIGLENRVVFTGLVRSPGYLLKNAEIFVSASVTEVFPMAICEAMACGIPAIVREYNESIRDIIEDGKSGILVNKNSQEDLLSALKHLMAHHIRRKELGREAIVAMNQFSPDAVMSLWMELFQQMNTSMNPSLQ